MTFYTDRLNQNGPRLLGLALGTALLVGCTTAPSLVEQSTNSTTAPESAAAQLEPYSRDQALAPVAESSEPPGAAAAKAAPLADSGQPAPQLAKRASLTLILTDLDEAVTAIQTIVQQAQGDVLNRQDNRSPEGTANQISLTVRVPQAQLETVLAALRPLGTVQQQSLTAEDISTQIVDTEARLKNLRQSETALLKIMERSGEISHVLEVARELSTVRESIERLTAQQQSLKRQVTYAYLDLSLQSPVTPGLPLRPVKETLGQTWQTATQSVKAFTVGGLKIGLWLLAYSPYLIVLAAVIYGSYRLQQSNPRVSAPVEGD
ncbi:MAG: DUF4349 domain-containing protein [Nodosilinea sp.]